MAENDPKKLALHCEFKDVVQLYRAYMSFVVDGAIFIPCKDNSIGLGDTISVTINLPEDTNPVSFTGSVIWLSPKKLLASDSKMGVGIRIEGDDKKEISSQIEDLIKDYLNSDQPTDTM